MIGDQSVQGFLDSVASAEPTPGGGSAGAVVAAMGAALLAMVARLTSGRSGYENVSAQMRDVAERADAERAAFIVLADRDAEAFDAVMAAFKLPKSDEAERSSRSSAIQAAFAGAAAVPLEVARRACALLDEAGRSEEHTSELQSLR